MLIWPWNIVLTVIGQSLVKIWFIRCTLTVCTQRSIYSRCRGETLLDCGYNIKQQTCQSWPWLVSLYHQVYGMYILVCYDIDLYTCLMINGMSVCNNFKMYFTYQTVFVNIQFQVLVNFYMLFNMIYIFHF